MQRDIKCPPAYIGHCATRNVHLTRINIDQANIVAQRSRPVSSIGICYLYEFRQNCIASWQLFLIDQHLCTVSLPSSCKFLILLKYWIRQRIKTCTHTYTCMYMCMCVCEISIRHRLKGGKPICRIVRKYLSRSGLHLKINYAYAH